MGKTSKWIRSFLMGKKDKGGKEKDKIIISPHKNQPSNSIVNEKPTTPISFPPANHKEKRRWSFRRPAAATPKDLNSGDLVAPVVAKAAFEAEIEHTNHAMAVAAATAAAAHAAVAAAQAAAAVVRLTAAASNGSVSAVAEGAAVKIQALFRSYLARKALCALKGLVKLQALVRGHLVRRQATATLRCMQALVTVQARARAQRIRMVEEGKPPPPTPTTSVHNLKHLPHRRSTQETRTRHTPFHEMDRGMEENIKIVEMDLGEPKETLKNRSSYSNNSQVEGSDHRFSTHYASYSNHSKHESSQVSPAPSAFIEMSPIAYYSGHMEGYSLTTAQSSPQYYSAISKHDPTKPPFAFPRPDYAGSMSYDYPFFPNYMANTKSSRAKARSQSAPKQRPADTLERQPTRRRPSVEGRTIPRGASRMQRSSSQVGSASQNYQYPWSVKLDRSMVSLKDSECGSTSTVLTNTNYCRAPVGFEHHGDSRIVANI